MRRLHRLLVVLLVLGILLPVSSTSVPRAEAAGTYSIVDLGVLPGHTMSGATGINASGDVAGYSGTASYGHAVVWRGGTATDLGVVGGYSSGAEAIGGSGQVVGNSGDQNTNRAIRWADGSARDLGTLGGPRAWANGVNAAGQVAGGSNLSATITHACLWAADGTIQDLGLDGAAYAVNDAGQVVGGNGRAFLWQGGVATDLGTFPGGGGSVAYAISSNGLVAGSSNGRPRPFLYQGGVMRDLGLPVGYTADGEAHGVNAAGEVVGWATSPQSTSLTHAFYYRDGVMRDLNDLLPAGSGWTLTRANAINDAGQIAGQGTVGGQQHAFRLDPVMNPIPNITALNPGTINAGGGAFTLAISGTSFATDAVVRWNGASRQTTFISYTQLLARIPASDIAGPGTAMVSVSNPAPGGGTSPAVTLPIVAGTPGTYSIVDLGVLPGHTMSGATGINGYGDVAGYSGTASYGHAVVWRGGTATDLGVLGGANSGAQAVNDLGQIVGGSGSYSYSHAASWADGSARDLGTLGGPESTAYGTNAAGQVVGASNILSTCCNYGSHAFLWTVDGGMRDLGLDGAAYAVNDAGQVVGGNGRAFLWQGGVATDLGTFPGGVTSVAYAISGNGLVAGSSNSRLNGTSRPFLYQGGVMRDLGLPIGYTADGEAHGVNAAGEVVGWATSPQSTSLTHAFYYRDGVMRDLNDLLPAGSGWTLTRANAINDAGQIAGQGTVGGQQHAFRLDPVMNPIPNITALSPNVVAVGGQGFTLTVTGSNFVSGASVLWQGTPRPTTFVSGTQLSAQIPASDIATTGSFSVSVANPAPGVRASNALAFTVRDAVRVVAPATLDFGTQALGATSAMQIATFANPPGAAVTMTGVGLVGANPGDFAIASDNCTGVTVAPGGSCAVGVRFAPTATGGRAATLAFYGAGSLQVALNGTGAAATAGGGGCPGALPNTPPKSVVIFIMGLGSSLPDNNTTPGQNAATFDPLAMSYCGLAEASATDAGHQYLKKMAGYFSPGGGATPSLPDRLAGAGAVLLPFSYQGATLRRDGRGTPVFTVASYTTQDPGDTLPEAAAATLAIEVTSIHAIWPATPIIIVGHSEGGLVAATYYSQYGGNATTSPAKFGVSRIFSLDSPINGVRQGMGYCVTRLGCHFGSSYLGSTLAIYYYVRWNAQQAMAQRMAAAEQVMPGGYEAIGTTSDLLYALVNFPTPGIRSQLVYNGNTPLSPPSVSPLPGHFGWDIVGTHMAVMGEGGVIDRIAAAVSGITPAVRAAASEVAPAIAAVTVPTSATGRLDARTTGPGRAETITGAGLGANAGLVVFTTATGGQTFAPVTAWGDTQIAFTVPGDAATGPVLVVTADGQTVLAGLPTILDAPDGVAALQVRLGPVAIRGQATTVSVTALDGSQQPMPNVAIGLSDGLAVQRGQADANGVVTFTAVGYDTQDFIAFSGTTATPLTVTWQDPPTQALALSASAQSVPSGQAITLSATVTDANGQPVAGQSVTFRLNGPTTTTLGATQATTNARGVATATATNSALGEAVVTASTNYDALAQVVAVAWVTPTYALALSTTTGGTASASPAPGPYDVGTTVAITATANAGYTFAGWTVDGVPTGTANPLSVTMSADHTVAATFVPLPPATYALTVTVNGSGTVAASPPGGPYAAGTTVTLTATPGAGYALGGWTVDGAEVGIANPYQLTMNASHTVAARFVPIPAPSPNPSPSPAPTFGDVPAAYWAYAQITRFAQRGITTGCGVGLYCPERGVTRAEMAVFLDRVLGYKAPPAPTTQTFGDVPPGYWAYAFIGQFAQLHITTGCATGRYCPDRGVTRGEMAAFLIRALGTPQLTPGTPTFADVPASHPQYGYIEALVRLGVTTGCGTDAQGRRLYCPERGVTRAEMAVFIIRAFP